MKLNIIVTLLIFVSMLYAQSKDTRAELDIVGRVDEICVSPDEEIWITTALGQYYYAANIDSNWHYGEQLFKDSGESAYMYPHFNRITFFNKNKRMITGYISGDANNDKKDGYYYTENSGKTWEIRSFGDGTWIYDVFVGNNGKAWMGGSSGEILYSDNLGEIWQKLNSPYNSSSRMNSIFMVDSTTGISGALGNEIHITTNNWNSCKKIKTPFDQKKYENDGPYPDNRIEKTIIWKDYIIVNQNAHIFYTKTNKIDWKKFSPPIIDFELDNITQELFAVTDRLDIIRFHSPLKSDFVTTQKLPEQPQDLKVVNHSLYVLGEKINVYKINSKGIIMNVPLTSDRPIEEPAIIKNGTSLYWGIDRNHIYLNEKGYNSWYREDILNFNVQHFYLKSDSVAILWDGYNNNYIYDLRSHKARLYIPENPIKDFLKHPITKIEISGGSQGCFHHNQYGLSYISKDYLTLSTKEYSVSDYTEHKSLKFKNDISRKRLENILRKINANPNNTPSLQDFELRESDINNYLVLVDNELESDINLLFRKKKIDISFYHSIPHKLETINPDIIRKIFHTEEGIWSTTSNWFSIRLINSKKERLEFSRTYFATKTAWHLPWKVEYKDQIFNCYNIEFSKFIKSCLPKEFWDYEIFNNKYLLMNIADYLFYQD